MVPLRRVSVPPSPHSLHKPGTRVCCSRHCLGLLAKCDRRGTAKPLAPSHPHRLQHAPANPSSHVLAGALVALGLTLKNLVRRPAWPPSCVPACMHKAPWFASCCACSLTNTCRLVLLREQLLQRDPLSVSGTFGAPRLVVQHVVRPCIPFMSMLAVPRDFRFVVLLNPIARHLPPRAAARSWSRSSMLCCLAPGSFNSGFWSFANLRINRLLVCPCRKPTAKPPQRLQTRQVVTMHTCHSANDRNAPNIHQSQACTVYATGRDQCRPQILHTQHCSNRKCVKPNTMHAWAVLDHKTAR